MSIELCHLKNCGAEAVIGRMERWGPEYRVAMCENHIMERFSRIADLQAQLRKLKVDREVFANKYDKMEAQLRDAQERLQSWEEGSHPAVQEAQAKIRELSSQVAEAVWIEEQRAKHEREEGEAQPDVVFDQKRRINELTAQLRDAQAQMAALVQVECTIDRACLISRNDLPATSQAILAAAEREPVLRKGFLELVDIHHEVAHGHLDERKLSTQTDFKHCTVESCEHACAILRRIFCEDCPQCGGGLVDEFPDCLGDGDYSPDGHMPSCERCIAYYRADLAQEGE